MGKLDGKVALISGAARGQGEAEARLFVAEGAHVVLGDILEDQVRAVATSLDRAVGLYLDVRDEQTWARAVAVAIAEFGGLDVLVNNAGVSQYASITECTLAGYLDVVRVNQIGVFLGMRAVAPALMRRGGGAIVNISSTAAYTGTPGTVAYTASKWAVRGMTKVAAMEFAPMGIRVNTVHPGAVDTPMLWPEALQGAQVDLDTYLRGVALRRIARPQELARLVLFLASDESSYCTGGDFVADGGLLGGTPVPQP